MRAWYRKLYERHIHRWHNLRRWWRNGTVCGHWTNPIRWVVYNDADPDPSVRR